MGGWRCCYLKSNLCLLHARKTTASLLLWVSGCQSYQPLFITKDLTIPFHRTWSAVLPASIRCLTDRKYCQPAFPISYLLIGLFKRSWSASFSALVVLLTISGWILRYGAYSFFGRIPMLLRSGRPFGFQGRLCYRRGIGRIFAANVAY